MALKIHSNYVRVIVLLFAYLTIASWIMINYRFDTGAVYLAMGLISVLAYTIAESLGFKDVLGRLIGIDDNPLEDAIVGVIIGIIVITGMEAAFVSIGYPPAIYPQTAFAERITLFSTFLVTVVLASGIEEIAFRGWVMYGWYQGSGQFAVGAIVSSVLFAAFHYQAYGAHLQSAYTSAFVVGMLLAGIVAWRKSLVPGIVIHAMINLHLFIQSEQLFTVGV